MAQITLTLSLRVTYETNGVPNKDLEDNLRAIVGHAVANGMLTQDTDAEVDSFAASIVA